MRSSIAAAACLAALAVCSLDIGGAHAASGLTVHFGYEGETLFVPLDWEPVNVAQVVGSSGSAVALLRDGRLFSWGRASYSGGGGCLVVPPGLGDVVELGATRTFCAARRGNGRLALWPSDALDEFDGLHELLSHDDIVDIDADEQALGVLQRLVGGREVVQVWNSTGDLMAHYASDDRRVVDFAAYEDGALLVLDGGELAVVHSRAVGWTPPAAASPALDVDAAGQLFVALTEAGEVLGWSANSPETVTTFDDLGDVDRVQLDSRSARAASLFVWRSDGSVVMRAWDGGSEVSVDDRLPQEFGPLTSVCYEGTGVLGVRPEGRVLGWRSLDSGYEGSGEAPAQDVSLRGSAVKTVALGYTQGLVVREDGAAYDFGTYGSWSGPVYAQLGDGGYVDAAGSRRGTYLLTNEGQIEDHAGTRLLGILGPSPHGPYADLDTSDYFFVLLRDDGDLEVISGALPGGIDELSIVSVAAGGGWAVVITSDADACLWASGSYQPELICPPEFHDVVQVAAGAVGVAARRSDGTVVSWQPGAEVQYPAGADTVATDVAVGASLGVVLRTDGTVTTWGDFQSGRDALEGLWGVVDVEASDWHVAAVWNHESCEAGRWGFHCRECLGGAEQPCNGHGVCDDGLEGHGGCYCEVGYAGDDCSSCATGWRGYPDCIHCDCEDDNPCTVDICDPDGGCHNVPVYCDDQDDCTEDVCDAASGTCYHVPLVCEDAGPCSHSWCEQGVGCRSAPIDPPAECDDGDPCTTNECIAGVCRVVGDEPGCCQGDEDCPRSGEYCDPEEHVCTSVQCLACETDEDCRGANAHCMPLLSGSYCLLACWLQRNGFCATGESCVDSPYFEDGWGYCRPHLGDCVCVEEFHSDCLDGHLTWFDSCGRIGERAEQCDPKRGCAEGACCPPGTRALAGVCAEDIPPVTEPGPDVAEPEGDGFGETTGPPRPDGETVEPLRDVGPSDLAHSPTLDTEPDSPARGSGGCSGGEAGRSSVGWLWGLLLVAGLASRRRWSRKRGL